MDYLRRASFGGLFVVTFIVAATFQLFMTLIALIGAILAPSFYNLNGAPAQNVGQALIVVAILLVVMLLINALFSAIGSALWLLLRKLLPRRAGAEAGVF